MTTRGHQGILLSAGGAGGDPYFANVSALLHMDGADTSTTFTDVTGKTWTVSGNAQIDTAQSQFGGASGLFDGTGDFLTTPAHAGFEFGSGEYTVEGWIRRNGSGDRCLFDNRAAAAAGIAIYATVSSGGTNSLTVYNNTARICSSASAALPNLTWLHWAVVRDGTTVRAYLGGTQTASGADSRTYGAGAIPTIGANYVGTQGAIGHIDEFRVTKGICRYPGGTSFTPSAIAFPNF